MHTPDPTPPKGQLVLWVVYFSPTDFPGLYVVRAQWPKPGGDGKEILASPIARTAPTLEEVRQYIPPGLFRMVRHPGDEQPIVETWL